MPHFAVIRIPDFALQAVLRHEPELREGAPVGLVDEEVSPGGARTQPVRARNYDGEDAQRTTKTRILQQTLAAAESGVRPGMTVNQARARCPELMVRLRSSTAEATAQAVLRECAWAVSSFVEDTAPGVVTVELRPGPSAVQTDFFDTRVRDTPALAPSVREQTARSILAHLAELQLTARVGFGPTPDLALLAAGDEKAEGPAAAWRAVQGVDDLAEFPLEALSPPASMLQLLHRWGIRTLGAFITLGRNDLVRRLGPESGVLFDRATGKVERPLRCTQPVEGYEESAEFEHEIETLEPLLFLVRRFVEQLVKRVSASYHVPAELTLRLGLADDSEHLRVFKVPSPTANPDTLFRMIETHLEGVTTEHAIISLRLVAVPTRPTRQQFGLFETALRDPNQLAETLARLVALLGHERVGTPLLDPTHRPDAFHLQPADFTSPARRADAAALPLGLSLRRLRPPQPALVQCERGPTYVHTREASGRITAAYGPMLLSGDWWSPQPWSRAEWDVRLADGLLCRIFEQDGAWFLEGVYD